MTMNCREKGKKVVNLVPEPTLQELLDAVDNSADTFKAWRKIMVLTRQRILLEFQQSIKRDMIKSQNPLPRNKGNIFGLDAK
ncbi:4247_t:CDS:2 [Diversispora eburnea]|uniref:4247_t:CDS:1 n=1 Tax=Diversispora eburnea TaxID=1213867 RepID=A0A9N9FE18_9GLOM|nr:4247_t:CDS:2 [Diversispora eburnea]